MTAPAPPIPADADLRPMPFMPLHVAKLRDSDLAAECEPEACWYAVLLWCSAWHQLPAGSLPDSDTVLCKLIGLGRDLKTWRLHKEQALRGWYLASDGRLYHPTVTQEVIRAWRARVEQMHRTECARIKKANQRNNRDDPTPTLEEFLAGRAPATRAALSQGTLDLVPEDDDDCPKGRPEGQRDLSLGKSTPTDNDTEQTQTQNRDSIISSGGGSAVEDISNGRDEEPELIGKEDLLRIAAGLARAGGINLNPARPGPYTREVDVVRAWLKDGIDLDKTALPAISARLATTAEESIGSLKFYDADVRRAHGRTIAAPSKTLNGGKAAKPVAPLKTADEDDDRVRDIRGRLASHGSSWLSPENISLSIVDGELHVTARTPFVRSRLLQEADGILRSVSGDVLGSYGYEIEVMAA